MIARKRKRLLHVTPTKRILEHSVYPSSLALAKAASDSVLRPMALRAKPFLFQARARLGSSLMASLWNIAGGPKKIYVIFTGFNKNAIEPAVSFGNDQKVYLSSQRNNIRLLL